MKFLFADRSWSNETNGRGQYACLVSGGCILAFFPNRNALIEFIERFWV